MALELKKSRVWSSAMRIITSPRSASTELNRRFDATSSFVPSIRSAAMSLSLMYNHLSITLLLNRLE